MEEQNNTGRISMSQPSKGCLVKDGTGQKTPRKDRRVSFFEKTHVRQVFYPSATKLGLAETNSIANDEEDDRRRSGSLFGVNFDHVTSESTDQESFEIPTKGATESMEAGETGIIENVEFNPVVGDSSMMDTSMDPDESLESPTGSGTSNSVELTGLDIAHINKTFANLTPIRPMPTTPLRQSFTLESGWTMDMPLVDSATKRMLSNTPGDQSANMDLTECATAQFEILQQLQKKQPQPSPGLGRMSMASTMEITKTFGEILAVNNCVDKMEELKAEMRDSPSRRYSLRSTASSPLISLEDLPPRKSSSRSSTPKKTTPSKTQSGSETSTPNKATKKGRSDLEIESSPMTRNKKRMMKQLSNSSTDSSTLSILTSSQKTSSPPGSSQMSLFNTQPSQPTQPMASEDTAKFPGNIDEEWIENVTFPTNGANLPQDLTETGLVSIPVTPVKVDRRQLMNALAECINSTDCPDLSFLPTFPPSVLDESCRVEIESYEKIMNDLGYLLDRDLGILSSFMEDPSTVEHLVINQFERDFEGFVSMLDVAKSNAQVEIMNDMVDCMAEVTDVYYQMMMEYENVLSENLQHRKFPINLDSILEGMERELKQAEQEYNRVRERFDSVSQLTPSEYDEANKLSEIMKNDVQGLKQSIADVDVEIDQLDQRYQELMQQQREQQKLKSSIRFDYEDVPSRDLQLEKAKEYYDLLNKVTCWSIDSIEGDLIKLKYRQGLACVQVDKYGQIKEVESKIVAKLGKDVTFSKIWARLDYNISNLC